MGECFHFTLSSYTGSMAVNCLVAGRCAKSGICLTDGLWSCDGFLDGLKGVQNLYSDVLYAVYADLAKSSSRWCGWGRDRRNGVRIGARCGREGLEAWSRWRLDVKDQVNVSINQV